MGQQNRSHRRHKRYYNLPEKAYATRAEVAAILHRLLTTDFEMVAGVHTVTFNYNYTNSPASRHISVKDGEKVSAPADPSRSGYYFSGWYTAIAGGSKFDFNIAVKADVTLYAHWSVISGGLGEGETVVPDEEKPTYGFVFEMPTAIVVNQERSVDMTLSVADIKDVGYEKALIKVSVAGPEGAEAKLMATDSQGDEYDIAALGYWGPETGFPISKDYSATTPVTASFDTAGTYTITISLVDVANANAVIAEKEVVVEVAATAAENTAYVYNEDDLTAALANANITEIIVCADFNVTNTHVINRALTIVGDNHTITASGSFAAAQPHVLIISSVNEMVTIENLTIDGNNNNSIKSGINAFNSTNVIIENVTIKDCHTVGLQVNNSSVEATNLNISGSGWGCSINVDKGTPSLAFHSGTLSDNVQIYTELVGQNVITVDEATGLKLVHSGGQATDATGLKGFEYYTDDMSKLGIVYNVEKNTVYETVEEAVEKAEAGNTIKLLKDVAIAENAFITVNKKLTIDGNNKAITGNFSNNNQPCGLLSFVTGSEGSKVENLTINFTSNSRDSAAIMITAEGSETIEINRVIFNGNAETIDQASAIIANDGQHNIVVTDCVINNVKYGMYFNGCKKLTVTGNTINGTNYNGINVASAASEAEINISNNTLNDISKANYNGDQFSSGISFGNNIDVNLEAIQANNNITMLNGKSPVYQAE